MSSLKYSQSITFPGICRYFRNCSSSLPILQLPIYSLPVGTWVPKIGETNRRPLAMLRPSASLSSVLDLLVQGMRLLLFFYFFPFVKCGKQIRIKKQKWINFDGL